MSENIKKDIDKTLGKLGFHGAIFEDLEFKPHRTGMGIQARMDFGNNYGVSVVQGDNFYNNTDEEYELAVMYNGNICYNTYITDDVMGYLSKEEVTKIMGQVQELVEETK